MSKGYEVRGYRNGVLVETDTAYGEKQRKARVSEMTARGLRVECVRDNEWGNYCQKVGANG